MKVRTDSERVRVISKDSSRRRSAASSNIDSSGNISQAGKTSFQDSDDEREASGAVRSYHVSKTRRDRVAPDRSAGGSSAGGRMFASRREKALDDVGRRRRMKSGTDKSALKVDTNAHYDNDDPDTPRTEATTPDSVGKSRSDGDIRSPGHRKSPSLRSAEGNSPIPDFITQTDRYGNASTPRSQTAIEAARKLHPTGAKPHLHIGKDGKLTEEAEEEVRNVDACAETFMDSIRIMCCCLLPDETPQITPKKVVEQQATVPEEPEEDTRPKLLPKLHPEDHGKKCLVLDLDETLVHSSFRAVPNADFVIPVQIEDVVHFVYVMKRPGVDEFLVEMAKHYEIVVYTASLNKYADPLLDLLDPHRVIRTRLFRESCVYYEGSYVKDLSLLDRDLAHSIIIDNSPSSYLFHPENAIDCSSFIDDPSDRELNQIGDFLAGIKGVKDVRGVCQRWREWPNVNLETQ